eukprot:2174050-Pleurochrysis_carterae.AAC.1
MRRRGTPRRSHRRRVMGQCAPPNGPARMRRLGHRRTTTLMVAVRPARAVRPWTRGATTHPRVSAC